MVALQLGIYLNSQHPEADDPSQRLGELVTQVKVAADAGFDSIWAGEHHLTPGYHFFPQLTLLAHLAAHSGDMALGTNLVLLPLHQPVDIAEQVALIDHACGGRFILTVGQGYRPEEFTAFGVPFEQRLARMVEGIEVIRRLWREDHVTHHGEHFHLEDATLRPGPRQPGGPPIWLGATTDRAVRRAGRIGDAFMGTPNADNAEVLRQIRLFEQARAAAGLAPTTQSGRMLEVFCHRDAATARRLARPHLLRKYEAYASWGLGGAAGEAARAASQLSNEAEQADAEVGPTGAAAAAATGEDGEAGEAGVEAGGVGEDGFATLARDRFVIGDPDQVIAGLVAQHRQIGLTHLAMRIAWPGSNQEDTLGCLRLLGEAVLPQVRAELSR